MALMMMKIWHRLHLDPVINDGQGQDTYVTRKDRTKRAQTRCIFKVLDAFAPQHKYM